MRAVAHPNMRVRLNRVFAVFPATNTGGTCFMSLRVSFAIAAPLAHFFAHKQGLCFMALALKTCFKNIDKYSQIWTFIPPFQISLLRSETKEISHHPFP